MPWGWPPGYLTDRPSLLTVTEGENKMQCLNPMEEIKMSRLHLEPRAIQSVDQGSGALVRSLVLSRKQAWSKADHEGEFPLSCPPRLLIAI